MFNQLMKQVTDLTVDTEERLKGVIDLVFEKAIDEPSFSVAYANMCRCLVTVRASKVKWEIPLHGRECSARYPHKLIGSNTNVARAELNVNF